MKGPLHRAMLVVICGVCALWVCAVCVCGLCGPALAQTHVTVRHHKEIVDAQPPEIAQAEDAIQKNDFAGAETLLRKALDKDPKNYQAWFDLGFVLNHEGRIEDSIHAY